MPTRTPPATPPDTRYPAQPQILPASRADEVYVPSLGETFNLVEMLPSAVQVTIESADGGKVPVDFGAKYKGQLPPQCEALFYAIAAFGDDTKGGRIELRVNDRARVSFDPLVLNHWFSHAPVSFAPVLFLNAKDVDLIEVRAPGATVVHLFFLLKQPYGR